jgi:hypothetical protein
MMLITRLLAFVILMFSALVTQMVARAQTNSSAGSGNAPIELKLNVTFIEALKDRATIDAHLMVDKVHTKPNPPSSDGDLHAASRSPDDIGLPLVAELMNAGMRMDVVGTLQGLAGNASGVTVSGVWRIWPEHGGLDPETQGDDFPAATTTNPEHIFEIHPLTRVGGTDVIGTLGPIQQLTFASGFVYKDAADAFHRYENASFRLECGHEKDIKKRQHTLYLKMIGYNYVDFEADFLEAPTHVVDDGLSVFTDIVDPSDHEVLVHKRRVWFVKGSTAYDAAVAARSGARLHIVGIPRVNLSLVSWRCLHEKDRPEALQWGLPYEMVAVGVFQGAS